MALFHTEEEPTYGIETLPVTLALLKMHSRIASLSGDDAVCEFYLRSATEDAETYLGRSIVEHEYTLSLNTFPIAMGWRGVVSAPIELPRPPVTDVASVKYIDLAGTEITMVAGTDYVLSLAGPKPLILPPYNTAWPTCRNYPGSVVVEYTAGYERVPNPICEAILYAAAFRYDNRLDLTDKDLPVWSKKKLDRYRLRRLG